MRLCSLEKIMPRSKLCPIPAQLSQSWLVASTIAGLPHYVHTLTPNQFRSGEDLLDNGHLSGLVLLL